MIDLTSQEMQSTFKKLERTTLVTNVTMCIVTLMAAAIAVWGGSATRGRASWSEIMFYILIAVLAVYFAAVLAWEIVLRRKNAKAMHRYVAEQFFANGEVLEYGGLTKGAENIGFETSQRTGQGWKRRAMCSRPTLWTIQSLARSRQWTAASLRNSTLRP